MCSTPITLEDLGFSVGVVSLSWFVPIIVSGTRVSPLHVMAVRRHFHRPWRGHACIGLGRSMWHFSGFNGTDTPAGYLPLRPYAAPLTPYLLLLLVPMPTHHPQGALTWCPLSYIYMFMQSWWYFFKKISRSLFRVVKTLKLSWL